MIKVWRRVCTTILIALLTGLKKFKSSAAHPPNVIKKSTLYETTINYGNGFCL